MKLKLHQQTTPYFYYGSDYFLSYPIAVPADYKFEFRRYATTSVTTYNVLDDYLNYDHGLELTPGNTTGHRGNENGILYYAEYLILKRMLGESLDEDVEIFNRIVAGLQVEPGLYDRGASDKVRENPKRTISHDNISAIASASVLLETNHAKEIASYGLKNYFIYNNNQRGFRLPMNPGNWSVWLAMGNKAKFLELLFLPFFIINFLITMLKKKEETSSRLLYFVELETLKDSGWHWDFLYELFQTRLVSTYAPGMYVWAGYKHALVEMFKIYFKNENHPINELARRL